MKNHITECFVHPVQKITFPEAKDNEDVDFDKLRFKNIRRTLPFLFTTLDVFSFPLKMIIQHLIQRFVSSVNPVALPVFV